MTLVPGKYYTVKIERWVDFGAYVRPEGEEEMLMPKKYIPQDTQLGDEIEAFIYHDGEGRWIATTERPLAQLNEVAVLKVKHVMHQGAFLDWGLVKDLFLPLSQQTQRLFEGQKVAVLLFLDELSGRIAATQKFQHILKQNEITIAEKEEVLLLVSRRTELGWEVVINQKHVGLIHESDIFQEIALGHQLKGTVKKIHEDQKIDILPSKMGIARIGEEAQKILKMLVAEGGFLPYGDKSDANDIYAHFGMSKKTFKAAIGQLYKGKKIMLKDSGIHLIINS